MSIRPRPTGVALAAAVLVLTMPAAAQVNPLSTTSGLRSACETSPGNRVVLNQGLTVNIGASAGFGEPVGTGCRIELINGASLQFDKVGLRFAGPLVITGGAKSGLELQESTLSGTSVMALLAAEEGSVKMKLARIDATTGDLVVSVGSKGKLEVEDSRTAGTPLTRASFAASGNLSLLAGSTVSATLKDTGLAAGLDLVVRSTGTEFGFGFENSGAHSLNGSISFDFLGSKSKLEASNAGIRAPRGNVMLAMRQAESSLKASNVIVEAAGSVQIFSSASKTDVGIGNGSIVAGGEVAIGAALSGSEGSVEVSGVAIRAGSPLRITSGSASKTIANGNALQSSGLVQISASAGGVCEAVGNRITAPTSSVCQ